MQTVELLKKIRKIEIRTRGLSRHIFAGEYHSAFKGKGILFSEVREYQYGDDIRAIDWNVTARLRQPFVKLFEEDRELTVILMIDVSGSQIFGSNTQFKKDLITELAAILSFSAIQNHDKIGVILFSDKVEKFIPPKKGRSHILRIIRELLEFQPQNRKTDINNALQFLINVIKKRSIVFVISDFISEDFEKAIRITSRKHDTIALRVFDKREKELPDIGLILTEDQETGKMKVIDTSDKKLHKHLSEWWKEKEISLKEMFMKYKIDVVEIQTDKPYIQPLMNFFKRRGSRR